MIDLPAEVEAQLPESLRLIRAFRREVEARDGK